MAKKAIVTGGSHGIGKGIVYALAEAGYDIAFSYGTREEESKAIAEELKEKYGIRCFYYQASLHESGVPKKLFEQAVADLEGLDLLVNNAGRTMGSSIGRINEETLDYLINLDFKAYVLMMDYAVAYMLEHEIKGNIINITSTRGERAYPSDGIYGGMKAALKRAIQSFAIEVAPKGIRINNVAPGAIQVRTDEECIRDGREGMVGFYEATGARIPMRRCGTPGDIANMVVFLASDKAAYITGITYKVDGGLILPGMPEGKRDWQ